MKGHITRIDTIELVLLIQMMPKKSRKAELGNSLAGHMYHDPIYLYLYLLKILSHSKLYSVSEDIISTDFHNSKSFIQHPYTFRSHYSFKRLSSQLNGSYSLTQQVVIAVR